ncbi:MAG TPA: ATP-binding protein [Vicinamibacterales bacterium]|nr:ATP-binding protein [Vicinamibacterales bacterium]
MTFARGAHATLPGAPLMLRRIPPANRRAIWLYTATIVVPVCVLLWLGLQSFERQRQSLARLTQERLALAVDAEARQAAAAALDDHAHPIVRTSFRIDRSLVIEPALRSPIPAPPPPEIAEAQRLELAMGKPDLALRAYRTLLAHHSQEAQEALALQGIARCLAKLGQDSEARETWRQLARDFPDSRDLAGRPFGIVAAINAGDIAGLFDRISSGRWDLSADQAEHFLKTLDPNRPSPYLERFHLARELEDGFVPAASLHPGEVYASTVGARRVFYRREASGQIAGIEADPSWLSALETRLTRDLDVHDTSRQAVLFYGASMLVVLFVLSAGMVLLYRDVSREARLNQLRSEFVSGVTHELKTPISIMRLYGETLLRQPALAEAERRDFYRVIGRESARLGRLVDQVLTFSRVERGDAQYDLQRGDLAPVVAGIADDYADWLEHLGFRVQRELPDSLPAVRFDAAALSQAVVNLLDNAVKFSGASRNIALRLAAADGRVTFEVEDAGVGIPTKDRERIFERFYRAPNDSGKGGSGLGLFMVRHIMEAHGGRAEVDSQPGQGSCFRLIFPVAG